MQKFISEAGAGTFWNNVWNLVKKITGDVDVAKKGNLQKQIEDQQQTIDNMFVKINEQSGTFGDEYVETKTYSAGSYVIYNNKMYKVIEDMPAGAFDMSKVVETSIEAELRALYNELVLKVAKEDALITAAQVKAVTEQGLWVDATAVRGLFDEVSSKLGSMSFGVDASGRYGYKKAGADTVIPFKLGYEDTPATASANDITAGLTAWVNGKLITGARPAPATQLSGSFVRMALKDGSFSQQVTFSTPFDTIPKISLSATDISGGGNVGELSYSNVSRTGFTCYLYNDGDKYADFQVTWRAYT